MPLSLQEHHHSSSAHPLRMLTRAVRNGYIKRITDSDIQSSVLEVAGDNVSTTYISCPADPKKTLGIKLPFLVMIIKNIKKYFTFEVTILDDKGVHRRFRASNYQVSLSAPLSAQSLLRAIASVIYLVRCPSYMPRCSPPRG